MPSRTSMRRETLRSAVVREKVGGGPPVVRGAGAGAGVVTGRPAPAGEAPPAAPPHALTTSAMHAVDTNEWRRCSWALMPSLIPGLALMIAAGFFLRGEDCGDGNPVDRIREATGRKSRSPFPAALVPLPSRNGFVSKIGAESFPRGPSCAALDPRSVHARESVLTRRPPPARRASPF